MESAAAFTWRALFPLPFLSRRRLARPRSIKRRPIDGRIVLIAVSPVPGHEIRDPAGPSSHSLRRTLHAPFVVGPSRIIGSEIGLTGRPSRGSLEATAIVRYARLYVKLARDPPIDRSTARRIVRGRIGDRFANEAEIHAAIAIAKASIISSISSVCSLRSSFSLFRFESSPSRSPDNGGGLI